MTMASNGAVGRRIQELLDAGTAAVLSDGRLLERFLGDGGESAEAAFATLLDRHGPMVWRVCRSILADPSDADDAFQATFLVMVRRSRSLWVRESLGPWLHEVARRTALRARTLANRRRSVERAAAGARPEQVEGRSSDDLGSAIHEEVARLPDRYRAVVVLCLLEGLPKERAAGLLGWPLGTVHSRLARGRERLRRGLARRGLAPAVASAAASRIPSEAASWVVPPRLIEATLRAASRLASRGIPAAAPPAAVAALVEGVSRMFWLAKLKAGLAATAAVGCVALATALGSTAAAPDAPGDGMSKAKDSAPGSDEPDGLSTAQDQPAPSKPAAAPADGPIAPASSIVAVDVQSASLSDWTARHLGTVIASTPAASLVLTSVSGVEIVPARGDKRWTIRGKIRAAGYEGEVVDLDRSNNLALIRIVPGRVLPASTIVPRDWAPQIGQAMVLAHHLEPHGGPSIRPTRLLALSGVDAGEAESTGPPGVVEILCNASPSGTEGAGAGLFLKPREGEDPPSVLAGVFKLIQPERSQAGFIGPAAIHRFLDHNGLSAPIQGEAPASPPSSDAASISSATVQVRVHGEKSIGFGLGTIISSTPDESIVLGCAHTFKVSDQPGMWSERHMPKAVSDRLKPQVYFPGSPKVGSAPGASSREPIDAELISADFDRDVALLRIKPGRILPSIRVAPATRESKPGMELVCIERPFQEPLEPRPTKVVSINATLSRSRAYRGVVCTVGSMQGGSGSGLFLPADGRDRPSPEIVGISNYVEASGGAGYYASLESIHKLLDANGLSALHRGENTPETVLGPETVDATVDVKGRMAGLLINPGLVALKAAGREDTALGTVIYSMPEESIILTAGRIFAAGGATDDPKKDRREVTTYYARYKTAPATPAVVLVQARGEVVDLDPARNVGLVRIRPGRVLPTIPIVPPSWRAKRGVEARTLLRGVNSEGDYACRLLDVDVEETVDGVKYQAFECDRSPQSSGVGGPLMVLDPPALAGVCNYSDMTKDAGLYAAPSMIYHILDANGLSHVYGKGNESLGLAPAAPFRGVPASQPAPAPSTSPAGADVDRVGRVERKVDEIDRKLDEILKAVGSPGAR